MSYRKRISMFFAVTFAAVVLATAMSGPQAKSKQPTPPSPTPTPYTQEIGVKAYTDWYPNDDGIDCFRQEPQRDRGSITLYFRVYASFSVKKATLVLYNYQPDGSIDFHHPVATESVSGQGNTAIIAVKDSNSPPHLGPGPYVATISASDAPSAKGGIAGNTVTTNHYYDTFNYSQQECWQRQYPPVPIPDTGAAAEVSSVITGHTEDKNGNPSNDDFPNCFRQDDSRDLVLTVNASGITSSNVTMILRQVPTQNVIFPLPPKIKNGAVEFRFRDQGATKGARKLALPQHLGSGPYVATATIVPTNLAAQPRIQPFSLTFGYDTYKIDRSECRDF